MIAPAATRSRPDRTGAVRAPDTLLGQKGGAGAAPRATRGACTMTPNRGTPDALTTPPPVQRLVASTQVRQASDKPRRYTIAA